MASDDKTPGKKEFKNEAYSELPDNQFNQVQPQKSEEKNFKTIPGDYKLMDYDDPLKILDAAPALKSGDDDDGNKVNNVKQNNKNNGKTPGNKEFKKAFSELPEDHLNQVQPQKSDEKDFKANVPGNDKLMDSNTTDDSASKALNAAPTLSTCIGDDGSKVKQDSNKNIAVQSVGCSGVSTGRPCGRSQPSSAEPFMTAKDERCPSLPSVDDYNRFDYGSRSQSFSIGQAEVFNILANMMTRTVSSEDDNRTFIEGVTRMNSFMYSGGAAAAAAEERGESCWGASYGGSSPEAVSSMPSDDVFVVDLKFEIIKMLQFKLETNTGKGWQELASLKDWNYSKIRDFENHCMTSRKSPFHSLLSEHEFQQYTLGELKGDLNRLPRKDVLRALNNKIRELYH